jgi:hypothetical protein
MNAYQDVRDEALSRLAKFDKREIKRNAKDSQPNLFT